MAFVYKVSSEECLGFRQRARRKEWMRADTWKAINNRRSLKKVTGAKSERLRKRYQQQYSEADDRLNV